MMIDTTQGYVKGDQIYREEDFKVGELYILENESDESILLIRVYKMEWYASAIDGSDCYTVSYNIINASKFRLNNFDYVLYFFMGNKAYKAVEAVFTCKKCGSHDYGMPIQAGQNINGQRVGRACNYYRCRHCNTINRHVWLTGYNFENMKRPDNK
jgi:hypothetical protein